MLSLCADAGSATDLQIDSNYVFDTSGEVIFYRFRAPVAQSAGALTAYFFCTAITGSPVFQAEIRNAQAAGTGAITWPESGGATLGTFGTDVNPTANKWFAFTFTNLTLVEGQDYFVIVKNSHGTPASNHATWRYRAAIDGHVNRSAIVATYAFRGGISTDGFAAAPTNTTYATVNTPCVVVFNSGRIMGFPYASTSSHASDANDRGNRVQFDEDVVVCGVMMQAANGAASGTQLDTLEITRVSDNVSMLSEALDTTSENDGGTFFPDVTLAGGESYNIVLTMSGATTFGTRAYMGEIDGTLPADVQACRPGWVLGWVGGAASPASYVLTEGLVMPMMLFVNNNPAIAGGGASGGRHGALGMTRR